MRSYFLYGVVLFFVYAQCGNSSNSETEISSPVLDQGEQLNHILVLKGVFDSTGEKLLIIEKPVLYKRNIKEFTKQENGRYHISIKYRDGERVDFFLNALVSGDRDNTQAREGFFEWQLPVKNKIDSIHINDNKRTKLVRSFSRKDIVPGN